MFVLLGIKKKSILVKPALETDIFVNLNIWIINIKIIFFFFFSLTEF